MYTRLVLNLQRSACLSFPSAGIKGMTHSKLLLPLLKKNVVFKIEVNLCESKASLIVCLHSKLQAYQCFRVKRVKRISRFLQEFLSVLGSYLHDRGFPQKFKSHCMLVHIKEQGDSEAGDSLEPERLRTAGNKLSLSRNTKAKQSHITVCSKDKVWAWWLMFPKWTGNVLFTGLRNS